LLTGTVGGLWAGLGFALAVGGLWAGLGYALAAGTRTIGVGWWNLRLRTGTIIVIVALVGRWVLLARIGRTIGIGSIGTINVTRSITGTTFTAVDWLLLTGFTFGFLWARESVST